MRIAILGSAPGWHVEQLARAGQTLGHETAIVPYEKLTAFVAAEERFLGTAKFDLLSFDRVLVRAIPPGSLEQVVFRLDALHRLEAAGVPCLNPPRAIEACVDKYLATARLAQAGVPTPRTAVCEDLDAAMEAFHRLGGDVVVKPLFGSEGRGIVRVETEAIAYRVLRTLFKLNLVLYLQEFVRHPGFDVRALVVGDRVLAAMRRVNQSDFRTNVALGATVEPHRLSALEEDLSIRAARAVGALVAGIDLMHRQEGNIVVLEVNSSPGFQGLSQTTSIDIPQEILRFLIRMRTG